MASTVRSASRVAATSWTRIAAAPRVAATTVVAIVPPTRSVTSRPVILPMKRLARGAEEDRAAQLAQLAEAAQQLEVVLDGLAEADPGIDPDPLLGDSRRDRSFHPLGEERPDVVDDVVVAGVVLHRARVPEHVHQDHFAAALGAEAGQVRIGPQGGYVVDPARAGVERRLGDRRLRGVDRDRDADADQPVDTGRTRRRSSSAPTASAPGRVDSPPMSRTSAPSRTSSAACSTARAASKNSPPSEKESGVTFTTPMTRGPLMPDRPNPARPLARVREIRPHLRRAAGEAGARRGDRARALAAASRARAPGSGGTGSPSSSSPKTSSSDLPARRSTNCSASIVSRSSRIFEIRSRSSWCSVRMSLAVWWASSTTRRISSSISRAISSE